MTSAITGSIGKIPGPIKQGVKLAPKGKEEWLQSAVTTLMSALSRIPTSSLTDEIERVLRQLEGAGVRLEGRADVWEYLLDFPGLLNVLAEAVHAVSKHFAEARLILQVYHDPEIEDRYLLLCVRPKSYDESVVKRLEAAEAEFIERLADEEGWLQLTTDFEESEDAL